MASRDYDVVLKALADFSSLSRAAKQAKADLDSIKRSEDELNATTVTGEAAANKARDSSTRKIRDLKVAEDSAARAALEHAAAAGIDAAAMEAEAKAADKVSNAHTSLSAKVKDSISDIKRQGAEFDNTGRSADRLSGRFSNLVTAVGNLRRQTSGGGGNDNFFSNLSRSAEDFSGKLSGFGNVLRFFVYQPMLALLALLEPAITALASLGGAALGAGSDLVSLAGSALAALPAIAALLTAVGALVVGFQGIKTAFSAYTQQQKASGAAGGGGSSAIQTTNSLISAQHSLLIANRNLLDSEKSLEDARQQAIKSIAQLQDEVAKGPTAEAQAVADLQKAKENLANVLATPSSTLGDQQEAAVGVTEAQQNLADVQKQNIQNQQDLNDAQAKGVDGADNVIQAQQRMADAQYSVGQATRELAVAQENATAGSSGAAKAADVYQEALAKLSPSARAVVTGLVAMKDQFTALRQNVQESLFSQIAGDLPKIADLLPSFNDLLSKSASAIGQFAHNAITLADSGPFKKDFATLATNNATLIDKMGKAFLFVLDALRNLTIAAEPYTQRLADDLEKAAKHLDELVTAGRNSGAIASYLDKVHERAAVVLDIFKNLGGVFFNLGKASTGFGESLIQKLDDITKHWREVSAAQDEPNSKLQKYLQNIQPLLHQIAQLFGDLGRAIGGIASDNKNIATTADLISKLDTVLLPELVKFFNSLGQSGFFTNFVKFVSSVLDLLSSLSGAGLGILSTLAKVFTDFANALNFLVHIPFFGTALVTILTGIGTALALIAAASAIAKFTGLLKLADYLGNLTKSYKEVTAAAKITSDTLEAEAIVSRTTAEKDLAAATLEETAATERAVAQQELGINLAHPAAAKGAQQELGIPLATAAAPTAAKTATTSAESSVVKSVVSGAEQGAVAGVATKAVSGGQLALAAVVAGIAVYSAGSAIASKVDQENKQLFDGIVQYKNDLKGFSDAVKAGGGVVGDYARQVAEAKLQSDGLADKAAKAGVSVTDLTAGVTGSDEQFTSLVDTWKKSGQPADQTIKTLLLLREAFVNSLTPAQKHYNDLVSTTSEYLGISADKVQDYANAMGITKKEIEDGTVSQDDLNTAVAEGKDIFANANTPTKNLASAIQDYNANAGNAKTTTQLLNAELDILTGTESDEDGVTSSTADLTETISGLGDAFTDAYNPAKAFKDGAIDPTTESGAELYKALSNLKDGVKDVADAQLTDGKTAADVATDYNANIAKGLQELKDKGKISSDQYQTLLDKYKLTPAQVSTFINTPNLATTQAGVQELLNQLGGLQNTTWNVRVALNISQAKADLQRLLQAAGVVNSSQLTNVNDRINALDLLSQIKGGANGGVWDFAKFVNGGIAQLETYANGGYQRRDDHIASILAPGTMRLMAEPETGGEAYIPLATTKRSRSLDILSSVMQRFGVSGNLGDRPLGTNSLSSIGAASSLNTLNAVHGSPRISAMGGTSPRVTTHDNSISVANLNVINPSQEPTSESLPRSIRKLSYLSTGPAN